MRGHENILLVLFIVGTAIPTCQADPAESGVVTVGKIATDAGNTGFDFASPQFGDFTLYDGLSESFAGLASGDYQIRELTTPGWQLAKVRADSSTSAATDTLDWLTSTLSFHLDAGEILELTFHNRALEPPEQSTRPPAAPAPSAILLVGLGAALSATMKRHRFL